MPHYDPAPHREARGNERWILLGSFVLGLVALVAIVLENYEPVRLAPVFMLLAWFPLIALHELGHAAMARAVGWEVDAIVVGFGGVAFELELFGVPCALKMYPIGGYMRPAPLDTRRIRLKSALVYLAGPLAEVLLVLLLTLVVGVDAMLARTDAIGVIAAQAISVAALFSVLSNLVPRPIDTEHGPSYTDGLGALRALWRPQRELDEQVRHVWIDRLAEQAERDDPDGTVVMAERAKAALPHDPHLRSAIRMALRRVGRAES